MMPDPVQRFLGVPATADAMTLLGLTRGQARQTERKTSAEQAASERAARRANRMVV